MMNKPWQKQQSTILYLGLAFLVGVTRVSLDSPLDGWQKLWLIVGSYMLALPILRYLHEKHANTFAKVFVAEYELVSRVVQRFLNTERIPFTKQTRDDQVDFYLKSNGLKLVVEFFPLNLPMDDQLQPVMAAKVSISPVTARNDQLAAALRQRLDEVLVKTAVS
ncbi:MAG: hypothetical protein KDE56_21775 [Anaerolineales bacterium]|nr:hypothetical protein [Anaerolineales bacterium]